MRQDIRIGQPFPDITLPETTGTELALGQIARGQPLVLAFVRGWWCPKEQVRVRNLVAIQDELQREFGRIAAVTVDEPYVNGAFRAGIGADFPFLCDVDREVAGELDLLELTDETHRPFLPYTFVLDSLLVIRGIWCGFWYWGNPTQDELRLALREINRREQPSFDPQGVWAAGGAARRTPGSTPPSSGSARTRRAMSSGAASTGATSPPSGPSWGVPGSTGGRGSCDAWRRRTAGRRSTSARRGRRATRISSATTSPQVRACPRRAGDPV
jgi:peroxiredoxin